jgi:phosphohistidine phosphatase
MKRKLYLVRHAEAFQSRPNEIDLQRELTPQGINDASNLHNYLVSQKIEVDLMLHSHAKRTAHTAALIAPKIAPLPPVEEPKIYAGSVATLMNIISCLPSSINSIAMVGHNPTISWLASDLCENFVPGFLPCTLVALEFDLSNWIELKPHTGKLEFIKVPNIS